MTYYEANSGLKAVIFRQDGFNKAFDAVGNQLYHTLHAPVFLVIEDLTPNNESLHRYVLDKEHLPYFFSMTVRTKIKVFRLVHSYCQEGCRCSCFQQGRTEIQSI